MRDIDETLRVLHKLEEMDASGPRKPEALADGDETGSTQISPSSLLQALDAEGFDLVAAAVRLADGA